MHIAIIPARKNSKRIKDKNIVDFHGKPIISYAIKTALNSNIFDRVIVSTDSREIEDISIRNGAEVPFMRSSKLSDDITGVIEVVRDTITNISNQNDKPKYVSLIYPCTPLLQVKTLIKAYKNFLINDEKFVISVSEFLSAPQRGLIFSDSHNIKPMYPEYEKSRTQDIKKVFYDCGQFIIGKTDSWFDYDSIHSNGIGLVLPFFESIDIDNENDLNIAKLIFTNRFNLGLV